jgi:hypothetical protein
MLLAAAGAFLVAVLLLGACGTSSTGGSPDATATDGSDSGQREGLTDARQSDASHDAPLDGAAREGGGPLPLGTVTQMGTGCSDGGVPDFDAGGLSCYNLSVICPNAAALEVSVRVTEPTGTVIGTIVLHSGLGGTSFFNAGGDDDLLYGYLAAGYRLVDVKWAGTPPLGGWWNVMSGGPESAKAGACRPATLFKWLFDNVHGSKRDEAFCGQGHSGGSAAMSYSLAWYGLGDYFDYVMLTQGPPLGRMDCGCDRDAAGCMPPPLPGITEADLIGGMPLPTSIIDGIEPIGNQCNLTTITAASIQSLYDDSVASEGGVFSYPETNLSEWYCEQKPNGTGAGAAFYLSLLTQKPEIFYSPNCETEDIYNSNAQLPDGGMVEEAMLRTMTTECTPRH